MALLKYLKPAKDHLPDGRESLTSSVPSHAIVQASLEPLYKMFTNSGAPYVFIYVGTTNARFTLEFIYSHFN